MSREKKIPHFRLYIDDFMSGTAGMTAAEVGDYIRRLCAIYDNDGRIQNDPYMLRFAMRYSRVSDVVAKVQRLIDLGKLSIDADGYLHNGRADHEVEKRHEWRERHPKNIEKNDVAAEGRRADVAPT